MNFIFSFFLFLSNLSAAPFNDNNNNNNNMNTKGDDGFFLNI